MERLSHIIMEAVDKGRWKGIKLSKEGPTLTHLFFDDMVLFIEASIDQVNVVKDCLDQFFASSGQNISLSKSKLFVSTNVSDLCADYLAQCDGIPITKDLGKHLGVPSLHGRVSESTFAAVLDRIKSRLEGWRAKQLSLAGR